MDNGITDKRKDFSIKELAHRVQTLKKLDFSIHILFSPSQRNG
jgi:hypothetical protein